MKFLNRTTKAKKKKNMQNIIKKLRYSEIIENCIFALFLARFEWKALQRFSILGQFSQWKKTEWANDLKFCTQVIGLYQRQMEHLSQKIIADPVM
jgi:hypothetical protein